MGLGAGRPAVKRRSRTRASLAVAAGPLLARACGGSEGDGDGDGSLTVGVLLPGGGASRFGQFDKPLLQRQLKRLCPDRPAPTVAATSDPAVQRQQIESMITRQVDVPILAAVDPQLLRPSVEAAHRAGIPAAAYDRLAQGPISGHVTFDGATVGRLQGEALLKAMAAEARGDRIVMTNGATTEDVPAVLLPSVPVTVGTIKDTVVKDGMYTVDQLCTPELRSARDKAGLT
ncbi:substrate-binding domain-containing protein [Streptomyces rishiriensis]|uniref:ABC-type xylose transport system substrate-binding protein n=1 Tax=Streptomyces rishiriensis TaxID=68264 RepID=A0ABU0NV93_STRRH|nr:substrate-binding domain-containing protein [Streptomyces rishiriensis]MDQ0582355.1 ABC-type xylose transport system substrate-binding protein [Streptomyces rishiriensis]